MRFRRSILVFIIAIFLFIGCKQELKVYRIGALLPLSGDQAAYGQAVKNGITLAMNQVNAQGGIKGKPIDIYFEDDQSSDKTAIQKVNLLSEQVHVIIGGVTSTVALAIAPVCEAKKVILLSPTASSPKVSTAGQYIFRNYPSDTLEGHTMAEYAVRRMKVTNVAILTVDNEYGEGITSVFKDTFEGLKGKVLYEKSYPQGTSDFAAMVKEIKALAPDAIYLPGYYQDIASILKELKAQKVESKIMSVEGVAQPMILEIAGDAAEGLVYPQPPYDPESSDPKIVAFVKAYKAKFPTKPDIDSAFGYDALMIVAKAIERCANYPVDLQSQVADTSFTGITGEIAFDENGDVNIAPRMFQIKEGKFMLVE